MSSAVIIFLASGVSAYYLINLWGKFCESAVQCTIVGALGGLGAGMAVSTLLSVAGGA